MADLPFLGDIRAELTDRFRARELALTRGRDLIRSSANAIRALHREEWEVADARIAEADSIRDEIMSGMGEQPAMIHAGFVSDAVKELAEAHLTRALFLGREVPGPDDLGIDPVPWLHGLGEAVGELRRRMLDKLRAGEVAEAEVLLTAMDDIVDQLAEIDYPDGMTHGLRRTTDVARSLTERSRADLTATVVQERLRVQLEGR
ncbi:MAG TPA: haloacid dehalogenase [Acidimicrobiia bacterium]|nr:haloacid dehalogenase [Acidimicrobiia bacterium]